MRRAPAEVKKLEPDPVYRSVLVTQVINKVLWKGKKGRRAVSCTAPSRSSTPAPAATRWPR